MGAKRLEKNEKTLRGTIWKHYKGEEYEMICIAENHEHPYHNEVVYRSIKDDEYYTRSVQSWASLTADEDWKVVKKFTYLRNK